MSTTRPHAELLDLLDALCDERLTADGAARLERLVLGNVAARRLYVDYLHLHGTLLWDAARGDAPSVAVPQGDPPTVIVPRNKVAGFGPRRGMLTAASVAVALLMVFWLGSTGTRVAPPPAPQVAAQGPLPAVGETSPPRDDASRLERRPVQLPAWPEAVAESRAAEPLVPAPVEATLPPGDPVAVADAAWARRWGNGPAVPPPARDADWLRRVSLDLAGHVPPAGRVEEFLADRSPDKRAALVEELLAGPHFARHFATVWTNRLVGHDPPAEADRTALYGFLRDSFAANRPWDETAAALVSAHGSASEHPAANFLIAHVAGGDAANAAAATADVLLGEQAGCARCHDHPGGSWDQRDFWQFAAFFEGLNVDRGPLGPSLTASPVGGPIFFENLNGLVGVAEPKFDGPVPASDRPVRDVLASRLGRGERPRLAEAFTGRLWSQLVNAGAGPTPDSDAATEALARRFAREGYDVKGLIRLICSTRAYAASSGSPTGRPLTPEQVYDSIQLATGGTSAVEDFAARDLWVRGLSDSSAIPTRDAAPAACPRTITPPASAMAALATFARVTPPPAGSSADPSAPAPDDPIADLAKTMPPVGTTGDAAAIRRFYLATVSRPPAASELAAARRLVRDAVAAAPPARQAAVRAETLRRVYGSLLRSPEFLTVP